MRAVRQLALAMALLLPCISGAQELVAADVSAKTILRALSYDRGLKARATDALVVGILTRQGDPTQDASAFAEALKALGNVTVQQLPLRIVALSAATGAEAAERIAAAKPQVLYVGAGFEGDSAALVQAAAAKARVLTTYRAPGYEDVFALGVLPRDGKLRIVIKLATARECGADLDAQLLKLAQVK